jgi:hypothetical protein
MAITSATARADIFKEFYAVVKNNISTTGVKVTSAFVDDTTEIPQVVVHAPMLPRQINAFGTTPGAYDRSGELDIEVYGNTMKEVVELLDDVENTLFTNLASISVQNVQLGDSSPAQIEVGGKNVHVFVIPIAFKFVR